MRRNTIFYKLFSQFPGLLFELMTEPPRQTLGYQFESIEVKETAFRIDGVFLPPDDANPKVVCFAEVQLQKDEALYDRFFAETAYFLRWAEGRYDDWRGVVISASRQLEPSKAHLHRSLLAGPQMQRIYLHELSAAGADSLGIRLMRLTMATDAAAVEQAKALLNQSGPGESALMDLVTTIMVYKLSTLSREEIEAMLGLNWSESRVLREERQQEAKLLVLRLLNRRVGPVPDRLLSEIHTLSLEQLESLGEALLDFSVLADLEAWLAIANPTPPD